MGIWLEVDVLYANPVNVFVSMTGNTLLFACFDFAPFWHLFFVVFFFFLFLASRSQIYLAKMRLSARNFVDRLAWFLYRCLAGILCAADREYASVSNSICVCTISPSLPFQLALIEFRFVFFLCVALLCFGFGIARVRCMHMCL